MDRVRTPDNVPALPAYTADGTPGYFGATTEVPAQWFNIMTEEIAHVVTGLGDTLPGVGDTPVDDQLWTVLGPRVQGIYSHATDTSLASMAHTRVVIGSIGRASGQNSAVLASEAGSHASGTDSAVIASYGSTSSGENAVTLGTSAAVASANYSAVVGASACECSGEHSVILAAYETDLDSDWCVGGGYNGLTWLINSSAGSIRCNSTIYVGGLCSTNSGEKITLRGITGEVVCATVSASGLVNADKGVVVDCATSASNETNPWSSPDPVTRNGPSGTANFFMVGGSTWTSGTAISLPVLNSSVGADSLIFVNARCIGGGVTTYPIDCGVSARSAGQFTVWARPSSTITDPSLTWEWFVLNPVAP